MPDLYMEKISPSEEWVIECVYGGPEHVYPHDWVFGGPDENDPRADVRFRPTTYYYVDDKLRVIWVTQTPLCDDQAIDEFTKIAGWGRVWNPVYLMVARPGEKRETLRIKYDKATDTASDIP